MRSWTAFTRPFFCSLLISGALAFPAHGASSDADFAVAVARFKSGQMSDAYGRFIALADEGDADAARIALFMYKFGPVLYGSHWDAHPDDLAYWAQLATRASGRPEPVVRPEGYVPMTPPKAKAKPKAISNVTYR
ncbi:MAG: hypothetical protein ABIR26_18290 [Ramlibacter sp.]